MTRLKEFKTWAIQCPEDEVAALIPHFGGAKVCDVGARCDLDSAGGTFGHHRIRTATVSAEVTAMRVRTASAAVTKMVTTLVQISGPNQPNSC